MHEPNAATVLKMLAPDDLVLDIGGWARCFNRANYVLDAELYETRGWLAPAQGGEPEYFSRDTWIQRDICDKASFPFADKQFDFVICSHTLEDVRDPLWVCSEIIRVGNRGYIEIPSRLAESSRGIEPNQVGWSHHRWLVEIDPPEVRFLMKYHMIHSHWRFSLPQSYYRRLPEERKVQWMFWENTFRFSEITIHTPERQALELERFVSSMWPYPEVMLSADRVWRSAKSFGKRVSGKVRRTINLG
jgi:SAM-dependent methyltransferase